MMNVDTPKYMTAPSSDLAKSKLAFSFSNEQPMKQQKWSLTKSSFVKTPTAKQLVCDTFMRKAYPVDERLIRRGMVQLM
jgi:hypothetical protein